MLESNCHRFYTTQTLHHCWGFATQPLPERPTLPAALTMPGAPLLGPEGVHSLLHPLWIYSLRVIQETQKLMTKTKLFCQCLIPEYASFD